MLDEKDIKQLKEFFDPLATKEDLKQEIEGLAVMMKNSFDYVDKRFDKIENILLKQQGERIESLERRLTKLEDAIALK